MRDLAPAQQAALDLEEDLLHEHVDLELKFKIDYFVKSPFH